MLVFSLEIAHNTLMDKEMKIKLVKSAPTGWGGNGFGNHSAEWVVKGSEHIVVFDRGGSDWVAFDTEQGKYIVRPFGWSRKEVIKQLEEEL